MLRRNLILATVALSTLLAAPTAFAQRWGVSIGGGPGGGISIGNGGGWGGYNRGFGGGWGGYNRGFGDGWGGYNRGFGNGYGWGGNGVGINIDSGFRGGYGRNRGWYGNGYDNGFSQGYVDPGYSSGYSEGYVGSVPYQGDYQQSYSPSMPAEQNFSGAEIKLRFPSDVANGKKVEYELNGHRYTMNGGDAQTFKEDRQWTIVFPTTEAAQDFKEYTLAGGVYKFIRKQSGWDLVRQTGGNEPTPAPTPADELDGARSSPSAAGVTRPGVTAPAAPRNAPGTLPDTSDEGFPTAPLPASPTPNVDGTPEPAPSAGAIDDTRPTPGVDADSGSELPPAEAPQDN